MRRHYSSHDRESTQFFDDRPLRSSPINDHSFCEADTGKLRREKSVATTRARLLELWQRRCRKTKLV